MHPASPQGSRQLDGLSWGISSSKRMTHSLHGCRWGTFYIFAYCGLVVGIPT